MKRRGRRGEGGGVYEENKNSGKSLFIVFIIVSGNNKTIFYQPILSLLGIK